MNTALSPLSRLDRIENRFPDMLRRWTQPMQMLDDSVLSADIRVDITENDKEYLICAEIPGAKKDEVRV